MTDLEMTLCQCVADLMNNREPDWYDLEKAGHLPREVREHITKLVVVDRERIRAEG